VSTREISDAYKLTNATEEFDAPSYANATVEKQLYYSNPSIRLSQGVSYSEGRVEVILNGHWHTICDPNWDIADANAVCNELGFGGAMFALSQAYFGEGKVTTLTNDRNCSRNEFIVSCLRQTGNCSHGNDVGVICFPHDTVMQAFVDFTEEYEKFYSSGEERKQRARNFLTNLEVINSLNRDESEFYPYGINKFTDLTEEEFKISYIMTSLQNFSNTATENSEEIRNNTEEQDENVMEVIEERMNESMAVDLENWDGSIPTSFDWRDRSPDVVTDMKDQGHCRSSYAFAATAQIETIWALHGHPLEDLSPQQIVSCSSSNAGCDGGWIENTMNYIRSAGGLQKESSYPYTGTAESCSFNKTDVHAQFLGWHPVPRYATGNKEYDMMVYVYRRGPIVASLSIGRNLQFYTGGVLSDCGNNNGTKNHFVVLTGFGTTESGMSYWVARNSWGTLWGNGGYLYIQRNVNMCGIADNAYAAYIIP
jgi:cathepsin L/cathepsin K